MAERLAALAGRIMAEFDEDRNDRRALEERWLEDYRLYMGIYDDETLSRMAPGKSRIFIRKAKVKTDTVVARLMDILFPRAGDRNWEIKPTPEPTLDAAAMRVVESVRLMRGDAAASEVLTGYAETMAKNMTRVMADQLAESPDRVGYRATAREVVTSACRYGMGIHKGPLVDERVRRSWKLKTIVETAADGTATSREAWMLDTSPAQLRPYFRSVPVWNFFWDMTARSLRDCRRVWEEYLMVYGDVVDLSRRQGFFGDVIREYLASNKEGDAVERDYEAALRRLGGKDHSRQMKNRFRVLERWGWLRGDELVDCGVDLGGDAPDEDYFCNIWLLGDRVIKAVRSPLRGVEYPYQIFRIEKDESGLCGQGVPRIMRHPQLALAAVTRAMLDNAAITSGPIFGVNRAALQQGEDPRDLHAFKVLEFDDVEDMKGAMMFWQAQSHTSEFLAMAKAFDDAADELTVPRWVHGDGNVADAAKTASGMSMLMGALSINLAEMIKMFDDDVTSQFITALYFWNMDFNPRRDIKGDFNVVALGSTALMAKEVLSQRLIQFLQLASQPQLAHMMNFQKIMREIAVSMQVPSDLVYDDATIEQNTMRQQALQAEAEQQARLKTLLNEMHSRGIEPHEALQRMLAEYLAAGAAARPSPSVPGSPEASGAGGPAHLPAVTDVPRGLPVARTPQATPLRGGLLEAA